jgi:MSHA biogenesis protein MshM
MYLEHFGLNAAPFTITPTTEFFFDGANRKEMLDALIYSINEVEGIIKVSGEVGSGKTMLCRMLLEKLPAHIEPIYLANPSLSREELLYAIADALRLDVTQSRIGVIVKSIQTALEKKAAEGKRIVVLVDEAHAMPLDTLEELRLLYNLQIGNCKLMQIILFGQPELNSKLEQPNMRQLKDRIVHHFNMLPLSRAILENYLMFRLRKAGYRGPTLFSAAALTMLARASSGLMRRTNILADKALLAAFIEGTHNIESRHIRAALQDSRPPRHTRLITPNFWWVGTTAALAMLIVAIWTQVKWDDSPMTTVHFTSTHQAILGTQGGVIKNQLTANAPPAPSSASATLAISAPTPSDSQSVIAPINSIIERPADTLMTVPTRYEARLKAGQQLLNSMHRNRYSIELFNSEPLLMSRLDSFLQRAVEPQLFTKIYLIPTATQNGVHVLYGEYPDLISASAARAQLPARYRKIFHSTIYDLDSRS